MTRRAELTDAERLGVGPPVNRPWSVLGSRPVATAGIVLVLSGLVELIPALSPLQIWSRSAAIATEPAAEGATEPTLAFGEAELSLESRGRAESAPDSQPAAARGPIAKLPPLDPRTLLDSQPKVPILDPSGRALEGFFHALSRTRRQAPGAVTRIIHFGDSVVASDYVSGTLRRKLQERFGDAGHGFSLIANAWPAYFHNDIERYATAGWKVSRIVGPLAADGLYGLGCVSFRAERHALSRFGTAKKGDFGRHASRFSVLYLQQPGGGTFQVSVDGAVHGLVETHGEARRSAVHHVDVPDGPHEFEILTKSGVSRLFGAVLERNVPGVVLDAIGIQGARIRFLGKQDDAHFAEQLALREPNLLVYQFGANESADGFLYPMTDYHRTMKEVLQKAHKAVPDASCLVVGAMDRAVKRGEELLSIRVLPHIIAEQRRAAEQVGCAFFDTFEAMGGSGSMPNWVRRGLGQADLTHPSAVGAELIGTWIFRALMQRYGAFVAAGEVPPAAAAPDASPRSSPAIPAPSVR